MRRIAVFPIAALAAILVAASSAGAQTTQEGTELEEARTELRHAREALEAAAREVARLSGQVAGPVMGEVVRQFRMTGQRAMIGINISDGEGGVSVDGVTPGGPAAEGGIETGDVIVAMDGAELTGDAPSELLIAQMGNVEPGDVVVLTVVRDGEEQEVEIVTRAFGPPTFARAGPGGRDYTLGPFPGFDVVRRAGRWRDMELVELTPALGSYFGTDTGILVVRAPSSIPDLRDGDVILDIGDRTPNDTGHAMRILASFEPGETLELTIMRDQRRQTLEIEFPENAQRG